MILFRLRCSQGHEFEGWFRDNAAYDRQAKRGEIECPDCGDTDVEKAPMAPRLGRSLPDPAPAPAEPKAEAPKAAMPERPPTPAETRRMLRAMRAAVEAHCDYVGPQFAEEARRIQRGESQARGIYGEATEADSKKLADEGIEVASIPWIPLSDA
jgi:hypothetical protein